VTPRDLHADSVPGTRLRMHAISHCVNGGTCRPQSMIFHEYGTAPSDGLRINCGFCAKILIGSLYQNLKTSPLIRSSGGNILSRSTLNAAKIPLWNTNISTGLQSIPFGHIQYHVINEVTRAPFIHTLFLAESATVLAFLGLFASNTSSSSSSVRPFVSTKKK
jgi:hypothetical protein